MRGLRRAAMTRQPASERVKNDRCPAKGWRRSRPNRGNLGAERVAGGGMTVLDDGWDLASDAELITAVRAGDTSAFGALYERHAPAARAVARQYSNSSADAEDAVADAFSRILDALRSGSGPDVAFRAYLFTVLRRVAIARAESVRRTRPTDDDATFEAAVGPGASTEEPT